MGNNEISRCTLKKGTVEVEFRSAALLEVTDLLGAIGLRLGLLEASLKVQNELRLRINSESESGDIHNWGIVVVF